MSQHLSALFVSVILLFLTFNIYSLTLNKVCRSLVALNVYTLAALQENANVHQIRWKPDANHKIQV